jgi:hypothetical protein
VEDSQLGDIEKFHKKTLGPGSVLFCKFLRYWVGKSSTRGLTKFGYLSKEENRKSLGIVL